MTEPHASTPSSPAALEARLERDPRDADAATALLAQTTHHAAAARTLALFARGDHPGAQRARRLVADRLADAEAARALRRRAGPGPEVEVENAAPGPPTEVVESDDAKDATAPQEHGRTTISLGAPLPDPEDDAPSSDDAKADEAEASSAGDIAQAPDVEQASDLEQAPDVAPAPPVPDEPVAVQYRTRLAVDPADLDALEKLSALLARDGQWSELAALYRDLLDHLAALPERNLRLEGVLWRKLAGLQHEQLDERDGALESFRRAMDLHASRETARGFASVLADAGEHRLTDAWRCQAIAPLDPDVVGQVARALDGAGRERAALVAHRTAALLRGVAAPPSSLELGCESWTTTLDETTRKLLIPAARDTRLDALFAACHDAFRGLYAHDASDYELDERSRLPDDDPLAVSVLVREVAMRYGLADLPALFVYRNVTGFAYAFFAEPTFIVGRDLLQAFERSAMRFRIGQLMTWTQPHAFLPALLSLQQLSQIVAAVCDWVSPAARIVVTEETQRVRRSLQTLDPAVADRLEAAVRGLRERPDDDAIDAWRMQLGVEALRTGALVVGDPVVAAATLREHPPLRGTASPEAWERELLAWTGSRSFAELMAAMTGTSEGGAPL